MEVFSLPVHPWVNDDDWKKMQTRCLTGRAEDNIRNAMYLRRMPPPIKSRKTTPTRYHYLMTNCKGRALMDHLNTRIKGLNSPRTVLWFQTGSVRQFMLDHAEGVRGLHRLAYKGQGLASFKRKQAVFQHGRKKLLFAHYNLMDDPEIYDAMRLGVSKETYFVETIWNPERLVKAMWATLRRPQYDEYVFKFYALKDTLDEELQHYLVEMTQEIFHDTVLRLSKR